MKASHFLMAFSLLTMLGSCKSDHKPAEPGQPDQSAERAADQGPTYAVTINGKRLLALPDPDTLVQVYQSELDQARSHYLGNLKEVKAYADYGKKCLRLGYVENALQVLSKGIDQFPNTADLYFWRGVAGVQGRQFQTAVNDLWKAGKAVEGQRGVKGITDRSEDEVKIDASLPYLIYHWMGLAFQSQGDYSNAEKMYEISGDFSTNSDLYCRAYYWQYQAFRRAGRDADAASILESVSPDMYISTSTRPYLDALLYFKGKLGEKDLVDLDATPQSSPEAASWTVRAYAVAVKAKLDNQEERYFKVLERIVATPFWNQSAYIAAEADHHRIAGYDYQPMEETELIQGGRRK